MKYVVAVSGGIDSVVLLHMLAKRKEHQLVVAHFDHGIRPDSGEDARFVEGLAKLYGFPFVMKSEELGASASEELARKRRYAFLREQAKKFNAQIVTAHHEDDAIESMAINLSRGTGWRGLSVLNSPDIVRPLIGMSKARIRDYAFSHRLEWVEDSTNQELAYLRNRLRRQLAGLQPANKHALMTLRTQQMVIARHIKKETARFLRDDNTYGRYFFCTIDDQTGIELLRQAVKRISNKAPTRPQTQRALLAIKTAQPGTIFQMSDGIRLHFTRTNFIVKQDR